MKTIIAHDHESIMVAPNTDPVSSGGMIIKLQPISTDSEMYNNIEVQIKNIKLKY